MKKITLSIFVLACFLCSSVLTAQVKSTTKRTSKPTPNGIHRCSSDEYNAELLKQYPNMMGSRSFEKKLDTKIKELKASRTLSVNGPTLVRIPVVVHVIHNGTAVGVGANISDAQVVSQIQVLNEDFRKMAGTRGENSHPDGADTNIEFFLAREDADCNPTTGIERLDLSSISTTWSGPGGNSDSVLKPMTIWDPSRYLNMWTVTLDDNTLLGYAQFPGGPAETDGVVMGYEYFGSNDALGVDLNSSSPYDLGRTTTHEVGHFLGLYHTFDGGCSDGDLVADTPPTADTDGNYGCPTGLDSCPVGTPDGILDMIENYMDYTNDACMNIFTNGQSARMDAILAGSRASLANSTVPDMPPASVNYDGSIKITNLNLDACAGTFTPEVRLANYGTITLTSATISYDLNNGTPVNYNWSGSLTEGQSELISLPLMVTPSGSNDFNVGVSQSNTDQRACNDTDSDSFIGASYENTTQIHLTLNTDDYGEEISWEFKDSSDTVLYSESYGNSPANDNATFNYSFDVVVDECYTFTISDSEGDGICCGYGIGSYELRTDDNSLIASGGSYAFSESTIMSTAALSMEDYFKTNRVSIYPNPTQTDLTISLLNPKQLPNGFQVYNMLGQAIFSKSISTQEDLKINTSILSKGMYFIKISKGSRSIAIPFIKK